MESHRPRLPSRWIRLVEYTFFFFAAVAASMVTLVQLIGLASGKSVPFGGTVPFTGGLIVLLGVIWVLAILAGFVWAFAVYTDAKRVQTADLDWSPSPIAYGIASFFVGIVPLVYLYKRHEHTSMVTDADRWWYVLVAFGSLTLLGWIGFGIRFGGMGSEVITSGMTSLSAVNAVVTALLPLAIYRDASYVRSLDTDWAPNPVGFFVLVTFGLLIPLLPIALAATGYYLYERHQHVSVP